MIGNGSTGKHTVLQLVARSVQYVVSRDGY